MGKTPFWRHWLPLLGTAALVWALDQFSKALVSAHLRLGQSWNPIPSLGHWFSITHVTNKGAAFGLFQEQGAFFVIIAVVVTAVILFSYRSVPAGQWLLKLGLGLQLGGALGNLTDRLRYGCVVDFIDFKVWPVFNLADSAITIGTVLLAYSLLFEKEEGSESKTTE